MIYIRRIMLGVFILTLAAWLVTSFIFGRDRDKTAPVITAEQDEIAISVADDASALLEGLTATDNKDGDITADIMIGKSSRFSEKGVCEVTYLVFDSSYNVGEYKRTVKYTDYESPVFSLSQPLIYGKGETVTILDRLTLTDAIDGDISDQLKIVSSDVDASEEGIYTIGVEGTNRYGDRVSADLPVNVVIKSSQAPEIVLSAYFVTIETGDRFDPEDYLESVTDGDGSRGDRDAVKMDSSVITAVPGTYQVLYTYTGASGAAGYASLTVQVREQEDR